MYPWYDQYNPTMELQPDDIEAIQHLYGAPRTPQTRKTSKPVVHASTTATTTTRSVLPAARVCNTVKYDAITTLRGRIYAFIGRRVVTMNQAGEVSNDRLIDLRTLWRQLPAHVNSIDAIFERPGSGVVVIFKGSRYWEFDGSNLVDAFPADGRSLTHLGIPSSVRQIDAALVGLGSSRRTYLFSGYAYWRLRDDTGRMQVDKGYPRDVNVWRGIPTPVDAAFTNFDGKTYFFKGANYWLFNGTKLEVETGYPRPIAEKWTLCTENIAMNGGRSSLGWALSSYWGRFGPFVLIAALVTIYSQ
jgi:hypothetical protein